MKQAEIIQKLLSSRISIFLIGATAGGVLTLSGFLILWGLFTAPAEPRLSDFRPHRLPPITEAKSTVGMSGLMGFVVEGVDSGGPADKAGVQRGDVLIGLNNHQILCADDYVIPVFLVPPGATHKFEAYRFEPKIMEITRKTFTVVSVPKPSALSGAEKPELPPDLVSPPNSPLKKSRSWFDKLTTNGNS